MGLTNRNPRQGAFYLENPHKMNKNKAFALVCEYGQLCLNQGKYAFLGAGIAFSLLYPAPAEVIFADFEPVLPTNALTTVQTVLTSAPGVNPPPVQVRKVHVTAYSSTPEETDDTPFITASGRFVRDGIVASNFLAMGTKIRIPALFGNKVFVVEDRMHPRMTNVVDIWMPSKDKAIQFGRNYTEIEILGEV